MYDVSTGKTLKQDLIMRFLVLAKYLFAKSWRFVFALFLQQRESVSKRKEISQKIFFL